MVIQDGALERLEAWKYGHKRRSVRIDVDDGYGAACWTVELWGVGAADRFVGAAETAFFRGAPPEHVVYVTQLPDYDEERDGDWPGLAATIHAAIDRAEALEAEGKSGGLRDAERNDMDKEKATAILRRRLRHLTTAEPDHVAMAAQGLTYEERAVVLRKSDEEKEANRLEAEALSWALEAIDIGC